MPHNSVARCPASSTAGVRRAGSAASLRIQHEGKPVLAVEFGDLSLSAMSRQAQTPYSYPATPTQDGHASPDCQPVRMSMLSPRNIARHPPGLEPLPPTGIVPQPFIPARRRATPAPRTPRRFFASPVGSRPSYAHGSPTRTGRTHRACLRGGWCALIKPGHSIHRGTNFYPELRLTGSSSPITSNSCPLEEFRRVPDDDPKHPSRRIVALPARISDGSRRADGHVGRRQSVEFRDHRENANPLAQG